MSEPVNRAPRRTTPRWVPYVGILMGSVALAPFAMKTDIASWPIWLRFPVGASTGIIMGYVSCALWIINNRGNR